MRKITDVDGTERVFFKDTGESLLLRCAICGAPVYAGSHETGSMGARYCSDELIQAWEQQLQSA